MRIRMYTSPKLRRRSKPIDNITQDIKKLAKKMVRFVSKDANCLGLAAPQIGKNIRLVVAKLELEDESGNRRVRCEPLINLEIVEQGSEWTYETESCLSCPGYQIEVARAERIAIKYLDLSGEVYSLLLSGLAARIVQHEIDHLDGILIVDKE